ncbi:MAG: PAS domain-containing sensor histidine kinase [Anaerolineales bacterium]
MKKEPGQSSETNEVQDKSIFDAAADGLIISDLETGLVIEANLAACKMHRYPHEKMLGFQLSALVHPDAQDQFNQQLQNLQNQEVMDIRTLQLCQDGQTFFAEWRGKAFRYQDRPCFLGVVRNVSKRIVAEQTLQDAVTSTNAELFGHAQALAVVEERQRLARNLHDAVNQSLFSAGLIAEVLPRLWERDQEEARRSLEDLRRLTRGAMAEMRALLAELRPSTLTDTDLGDLLHQLAKAFMGRTNVPTKVTVPGKSVLPAEVHVAIYRVCQEALNNVAKHAAATTVAVTLKQEGTSTILSIQDDGRGFDPKRINSGHYGLAMMQEHASAAGAYFSIASQPGHGTELTVRWTKTPAVEI